MISRFLLAAGLALLMLVTGFGSYMYLGARQSKVAVPPQRPTAATPRAQAVTLPGTLYLAQGGALYSLSAGRFHQLTAEAGWTQPALFPDGSSLLAVKRSGFYSDVYQLGLFGQVQRQLTNNAAGPRSYDTADNHWSFYPRLAGDGKTLFMSYDAPKFGYDALMSVWAVPFGGTIHQGRLWTNSNDYTGGDMQPVPLPGGGIVYTKYSYGPDDRLIGQLWVTTRPLTYGREYGHALTSPSEDCAEPSLSPDGHQLAMICTYEKQLAELVIAPFDGSNLGARKTVITDQMVAQPAWAPDGSGIAYFAPAAPDAPFQLWFLPKAAYNPPAPSPIPTPTPTPGGPHNGPLPSPTPVVVQPPPVVRPIQVTTNLGFDATSPIAWAG
ncbi:hypothetical protein EPN29_00960 [bacterium]|nr:MAG: hypothetical protein EPN29_00960 [bacterium]